MKITEPNFSKNIQENLKILQTVYAVSIVLGFRELANTFYFLMNENTFDDKILAYVFICYVIITGILGFRFFWCVGNFTRFLQYHYNNNAEKFAEIDKDKIFQFNIIINLIVLFLHSFVYFFLTKLIFSLTEMKDINDANSLFFLLQKFCKVYLILLFGNFTWLFFLSSGKREVLKTEWSWAINNLIGSTLLLLLLIGSYFFPGCNPFIYYLMIPIVLLGNSFFDFVSTSYVYIFYQQITFIDPASK